MSEDLLLGFSPGQVREAAAGAPWLFLTYFEQHYRRHKNDWRDILGRALSADEYDAIARAVVHSPAVRTFAYLWQGSPQVGFFCEQLALGDAVLSNVAVVYDIKVDALTNCHRAFAGGAYFTEKAGVQEITKLDTNE
jgi:hypothetical protein